MIERSLKSIFMATALLCIGSCAQDAPVKPVKDKAVKSVNTETASVNPNINKAFVDPNVNVDIWADRWTGESREVFALRHEILDALTLMPGDRIADIGAGTGLYIKLFAETVGPKGQVYANDISEPFLEFIKKNAKEDGLKNVTTILGGNRTSNLPDASVDIVFHSDVYHHFEYPEDMVRDLARVLVDGGEMFVLDFDRIEGITSERILNHVRASKELVITEIEGNGFALIQEIKVPELKENYLLHFRKE